MVMQNIALSNKTELKLQYLIVLPNLDRIGRNSVGVIAN